MRTGIITTARRQGGKKGQIMRSRTHIIVNRCIFDDFCTTGRHGKCCRIGPAVTRGDQPQIVKPAIHHRPRGRADILA